MDFFLQFEAFPHLQVYKQAFGFPWLLPSQSMSFHKISLDLSCVRERPLKCPIIPGSYSSLGYLADVLPREFQCSLMGRWLYEGTRGPTVEPSMQGTARVMETRPTECQTGSGERDQTELRACLWLLLQYKTSAWRSECCSIHLMGHPNSEQRYALLRSHKSQWKLWMKEA